jgi:hypothetical protein
MRSSATTEDRIAARPSDAVAAGNLGRAVEEILAETSFIDIHTHLFPPAFGAIGLWGIDELLTYHYLEAELFRSSPIEPEQYWALPKREQADLVWRTLFMENAPVSEAARGAVAVLSALGLDPRSGSLEPLRAFFREQNIAEYIPKVFQIAGIRSVVMTNDPLDDVEAACWKRGSPTDGCFQAALRLDRILNDWQAHHERIAAEGYAVAGDGSGRTLAEVRRFLVDWSARMKPVYMAVSLPDSFQYPADDMRTKLLADAVLPACRELKMPVSLMIGVRRQVNPRLRLAGDACGRADLRALETLCRDFPENRFLVSVLSRENQHELCVYARKFRNLMPFGCWWFLNNPSIVEEITRERLEMLGTSFIPQHSDARILEQVIYKWRNTRRTLGPILTHSYETLAADGRAVTLGDIQNDINRLFRTNFERWIS